MRSPIAFAGLALSAVVTACAAPQPVPEAVAGTCDKDATTLSGTVDGTVCGNITAKGSLVIPVDQTLTITKGSVLVMPDGASIEIDGTLAVTGEDGAPVTLTSETNWDGIGVAGTFTATGLHIVGNNAALFQSSGSVNLTDSEVDLGHAGFSPDCTTFAGGTVTYDHVHIHGCHCPMHIAASDGVTVTNSILDGAADPIMISSATAAVHHSHLIAGDVPIDDIGSGIDADVSGNYYGGGAPNIRTDDESQFQGAGDFSSSPFDDAGPRFAL